MRKSNWLLFLLFFTAGAANAHKDRILSVQPDGLIPEIPASFGRVSLNIKGLGSAAPMVQFRVGKYLTDLPSCVTRVILTKSQSDIRGAGSWYHDEKIVPYYLNVKFYDPGYDRGRLGKSNFSFLFNLRAAQLILTAPEENATSVELLRAVRAELNRRRNLARVNTRAEVEIYIVAMPITQEKKTIGYAVATLAIEAKPARQTEPFKLWVFVGPDVGDISRRFAAKLDSEVFKQKAGR